MTGEWSACACGYFRDGGLRWVFTPACPLGTKKTKMLLDEGEMKLKSKDIKGFLNLPIFIWNQLASSREENTKPSFRKHPFPLSLQPSHVSGSAALRSLQTLVRARVQARVRLGVCASVHLKVPWLTFAPIRWGTRILSPSFLLRVEFSLADNYFSRDCCIPLLDTRGLAGDTHTHTHRQRPHIHTGLACWQAWQTQIDTLVQVEFCLFMSVFSVFFPFFFKTHNLTHNLKSFHTQTQTYAHRQVDRQ